MRSCPKCKTTDYNNKYFVLMINECGHSLCKNCVETLFVRQSGVCPTCGRTLKKSTFWEQTFDNPLVEKEVYFRKKLSKVFNLKSEDFETLRQYNDYLERTENYIMNLTYDVDVDSTKREIEKFQKEYEDLITKNKNRLSKDEEWIQKNLDEERREKERLGIKFYDDPTAQSAGRNDENDAAMTSSMKKGKFESDAKAIIAELMTSDVDAGQIVGRKRYEIKKAKEEEKLKRAAEATKQQAEKFEKFRHGNLRSKTSEEIVSSAHVLEGGEKFTYEPQTIDLSNGPALPPIDRLGELGYLQHIKTANSWQNAGGYYEALGCYRALMEAHCDLLA